MNNVKALGKTLLAIAIVALLCVACYLFGYIKDNVWINYFFPYLSYHVFAGLFYYIVVTAYFSESSKDVISTIIGLCLSFFMAYLEYTQFLAAGKGQAIVNAPGLSIPDNTLKIVYGIGFVLGIIKTLLDLYARMRCNFSNETVPNSNAKKRKMVKNQNKEDTMTQEEREVQEIINELPKKNNTGE